MEKIGQELGIKEVRVSLQSQLFFTRSNSQLSDWYTVSRAEIIKRGDVRLFDYYASRDELLRTIYPKYPWEDYKFKGHKPPNGFWKKKSNAMKALEMAELKLGIQKVNLFFCDTTHTSHYTLT
jgi:hypothetical protein